jgi:hypothetical protein
MLIIEIDLLELLSLSVAANYIQREDLAYLFAMNTLIISELVLCALVVVCQVDYENLYMCYFHNRVFLNCRNIPQPRYTYSTVGYGHRYCQT